jgi:hypothetical protein
VSDRLERLLRETPVPGADDAAARGRTAVLGAFAARPVPPRGRRSMLRVGLGIAVAALLAGVAAASTGHLPVAGFGSRAAPSGHGPSAQIERTRGLSLPFPGEVLVRDDAGIVIVQRDGARRRLGPFADASWSPNARFVVLTGGRHLVVADPATGAHRWSITARAAVTDARWSLEPAVPPCCRIAYLSGGALHVIAGDGTGDHVVAEAADVAPVWRPHNDRRELAYAAPDGSVHLVAADGGAALAPVLHPGFAVRSLVWSTDGARIAVAGARRIAVYRAGAATPGSVYRAPSGTTVSGALLAGGAGSLIVEQRIHGHTRLEHVTADGEPTHGSEFSGALDGISLAPDGRHLLVGMRDVQTWIVLSVPGLRTTAMINASSLPLAARVLPGGLHAPRKG